MRINAKSEKLFEVRFHYSLFVYSLIFNFFVNFLFNLVVFAEGKPIPTELRNEEAELRRKIDLEDENTAGIVFL